MGVQDASPPPWSEVQTAMGMPSKDSKHGKRCKVTTMGTVVPPPFPVQGHRRCLLGTDGHARSWTVGVAGASRPLWYAGARSLPWGRSAGCMDTGAEQMCGPHFYSVIAWVVTCCRTAQSVLFACSVGLAGAGVLCGLVTTLLALLTRAVDRYQRSKSLM